MKIQLKFERELFDDEFFKNHKNHAPIILDYPAICIPLINDIFSWDYSGTDLKNAIRPPKLMISDEVWDIVKFYSFRVNARVLTASSNIILELVRIYTKDFWTKKEIEDRIAMLSKKYHGGYVEPDPNAAIYKFQEKLQYMIDNKLETIEI